MMRLARAALRTCFVLGTDLSLTADSTICNEGYPGLTGERLTELHCQNKTNPEYPARKNEICFG